MDKMTTHVSVLLAVALLASAGAAFAQRGGDSVTYLPCPWVATTTVEHAGDYSLASFSARKTTDLVLTVFFPEGFTEDQVVSLKVVTPRGHLYRQIDKPVTVAARAANPGVRRLTNYPHPVPATAVRPQSFAGQVYAAADVVMPVAGSAIVGSSLYGRWSVRLFVDGVEQKCGETHSFEIVE